MNNPLPDTRNSRPATIVTPEVWAAVEASRPVRERMNRVIRRTAGLPEALVADLRDALRDIDNYPSDLVAVAAQLGVEL